MDIVAGPEVGRTPSTFWRIGRRLAAGFALALVAMGVVGLITYSSTGSMDRSRQQVDHTHQVLGQVQQLLSGLQDAETGQRGYLITGADTYLAPYQASRGVVDAALDRMAELTSDNAAQQERISDLRPLVEAKYSEMQQTVDLRREQGFEAARAVVLEDRGKAVMDQIRGITQAIGDDERALLESRAEETAQTVTTTKLTVVLGFLLPLVVVVLVGWRLTRSITGPLSALGRRLHEIADGDGDLTQRVPEGAPDETGAVARAFNVFIGRVQTLVEQTAAAAASLQTSGQQLTAISSQLASSADEASGQAATVAGAAEEVSRNVQTVSAGTEEFGASIHEIARNAGEAAQIAQEAVDLAVGTTATVAELGQSSAEIGTVVKLITSIAEQTNLLALNATIEAARAGDAGKGFAVVADEVKQLAQETARATEDITSRVEALQRGSGAAGAAIESISSVIERINSYTTTIAAAVEQQSATTTDINRSISEAAIGTQQIAENITGVAATAQQTSESGTQASEVTSAIGGVITQLRDTVGQYRY